MNRVQLLEAAKTKDSKELQELIQEGNARLITRTIRKAKKLLDFKIIPVLLKLQSVYGVWEKQTDGKVDKKRYSEKLTLTLDKKNTELNRLVLDHCKQIAKLIDQKDFKENHEIYTFAFIPKDAKLLKEKVTSLKEVVVSAVK